MFKKAIWLFPSIFILGLLFSGGCYYDNLEELHPELLLEGSCDSTGTISYQTQIKPILTNSCGANNSCHNTQGAGGGVILENHAGVKAAANGKLLSSITWDGNAQQMPKGSPSKLNSCSIAKIQKWVTAGALNN